MPKTDEQTEYERRCSFDQVALNTARTVEAVFYRAEGTREQRLAKVQIAITDLLMTQTADDSRAFAAISAIVLEAQQQLEVAVLSKDHGNISWASARLGMARKCLAVFTAQHTPADAPAPQVEPAPSLDDVRREARREALEEAAALILRMFTHENAAGIEIAARLRAAAAADPVREEGGGT